jgi:hypothetical protein
LDDIFKNNQNENYNQKLCLNFFCVLFALYWVLRNVILWYKQHK